MYTGAAREAPSAEEAAGVAFYPDTEGPFKLWLYIAHGDGSEAVIEYVYTPPMPAADPPQRLRRRDARDARGTTSANGSGRGRAASRVCASRATGSTS